MKTTFMILGLALASTSAKADGFVCESKRENLVVRVYNHTQPQAGTRNGAVMVLSDSSVNAGNKTIARFSEVNGTLENEGVIYTATVDHRFNDSGRKGELVAGTNIGALKTIVLDLAFNYFYPLAADEYVRGDMVLVKRNGDKIQVALDCERYLKN